MIRRTTAAAASLALLVVLAGCMGPDPDEVTERAETVFAGLVDDVAAIDGQTLRTLEVAPVDDLACDEPEGSAQRVFTATGTLSVQAEDQDLQRVFELVRDGLDDEVWDPIRVDRDQPQRAWADGDGIVVAVTAKGPVATLSVFTPCLR
ncbi:hypothetical protein [Microbacterium sp. GXF7504]